MKAAHKRMDRSTQRIYLLYHMGVNFVAAVESMRNHNPNISPELVRDIYSELSKESEKFLTKKFHYYTIEDDMNTYFDVVGCWTSRYLFAHNVKSTNRALHEITFFDVFNDRSTKITVEKSARRLYKILPLRNGFGLMEERGNRNRFISLIFLDLFQHSLQKLHTVRHIVEIPKIILNKADPTTFILKDFNWNSFQICQIVDNEIIIGERTQIGFRAESFHGKYVYALVWHNENRERLNIPKIYIYDVEEKTKNNFDIEVPVGYILNSESIGWVREIVFVKLERKNDTSVIGCLNVQTRQWNILDFSPNLPIRSIDGFEEGGLIVHTQSNGFKGNNFYKIPFGNPDSLEIIIWFNLVEAMKKRDGVENPYEAAKKFLPLTSNINFPFENA